MRSSHSTRAAPALAALALLVPAAAAAQPIVLEDIIVAADRAPTAAERTGATVSTLTAADLRRDGRPFVLDALGRLPGVRVTQPGPPGAQSDIFLRGLPQRYVRVRVDGIEVSDPSAPQVAASLSGFLAGGFGRAEVIKGSQSALYGGQAIGGVIDITTPRPVRDGLEHRLALEAGRYDTLLGAYMLAARTDRADAALTLQRFQTDGFSAAAAGDEPDGYETTRVSASGGYYLTDRVRVFGSAFWQREDGEYDAAFRPPDFVVADSDDTFELRQWGARLGADFPLGPVESTLAAAVFDIDRRFFTPDGALDFGGEGRRHTVEYLGRLVAAPNLALQAGADYNREEATFLPQGVDADTWIAGAFAQATWIPVDPLTLGLALRHDEHSDFGGYTTGRLTAAYVLPSDTILRASFGTGFRPPSAFELFFGPFGNPDLQPETSQSWDVGVEQRLLAGRARVAATVFRVEIDDIIGFGPDGFSQVPGTTRSRGVELAGSWDATDRLTLTAAYTYTDSEQPTGARTARVPRHDAALGAEARVTDRLSLAATLQHVADVVDGVPLAPLDDYTVVNARAAYALTDSAEAYLRVENLFDEQYQTVRGYNTSDRAFYVGVAARF